MPGHHLIISERGWRHEIFTWNGEAMIPARPKAADKGKYVIGRRYWLEEVSDRSWISHRQEFAWIAEAWMNLPHDLADLYPSPAHLRKRALIQAGFYNETIIDAGSKAGALRMAAYARGEDEFAAVFVRGPLVIVRKAKSQRMRTATTAWTRPEVRKRQGAKKAAILEVIAEMIKCVDPKTFGESGMNEVFSGRL